MMKGRREEVKKKSEEGKKKGDMVPLIIRELLTGD